MSTNPESLPDAAQHVHTTEIAVRWGDMDAGGHVNNSRCFTDFEEAWIEWLKATLDGPLFADSGPVLVWVAPEAGGPVPVLNLNLW